ncbi:MAG: hypothetical protein OEW08_09660 [Gammaproteobacteria bacterium]|nr:hypothetical protein [Gammaproteobacteria bacterium]
MGSLTVDLPLGGDVFAAGLAGDDLPLALVDPLAGAGLDLGFLTTIRVLLHHEVKVKPTFLPKTGGADK